MVEHSADCADCGYVVEGEKGSELIILSQQTAGYVITRLGGRRISLELSD